MKPESKHEKPILDYFFAQRTFFTPIWHKMIKAEHWKLTMTIYDYNAKRNWSKDWPLKQNVQKQDSDVRRNWHAQTLRTEACWHDIKLLKPPALELSSLFLLLAPKVHRMFLGEMLLQTALVSILLSADVALKVLLHRMARRHVSAQVLHACLSLSANRAGKRKLAEMDRPIVNAKVVFILENAATFQALAAAAADRLRA